MERRRKCCLVALVCVLATALPTVYSNRAPGRFRRDFTLDQLPASVSTPPKLNVEPPEQLPYKHGEELTLPCVASGSDPLNYTWLRDLAEVHVKGVGMHLSGVQGTLVIDTNIAQQVAGEYQCWVSNQLGVAVSRKCKVLPAYIDAFDTKVPKKVMPKVGSYLNLTCEPPDSFPEPSIKWALTGDDEDFEYVTESARIAYDYEAGIHFANIVENDKGLYSCNVKNEILKQTSEGDEMSVETFPGTPTAQAPILKWHSAMDVVVVAGENVKLKCIYAGFPTPSVQWEKVDGRMGDNVKTNTPGNLEIVIKKAEADNAGKYRCSATSTGFRNAVSRDFRVTVQYKPQWKDDVAPKDVFASFGDNTQLSCAATGEPEPTYTYKFNGKSIAGGDQGSSSQVTIEDGGTVRFNNLAESDTQVIQCNASNIHGYVYTNIFLNVLAEPPHFIEKPDALTKQAVGQEVLLKCRVFGAPTPRITWLRGDPPVEVQGHRFTVMPEGDLRIRPAVKEDESVYHCQAENRFGMGTENGHLLIRERTVIDYHPKSKTVRAAEEVTFFCNATTDPAEEGRLTIRWLRNDSEINFYQSKISMDVRDKTLTIAEAMPEDTNSYTCVASNGIDEDRSTAQLKVQDRPDPPTNLQQEECSSSRATISWTPGSENNDEVIEFIVKYNVTFDKGVYYVGAKVRRGVLQAEIELSPWANYTFHVIARNSIGVSDKSAFTPSMCKTVAKKPTHDPDWVCTSSEASDQLVVKWKTFPPIMHNGSDFHYLVKYRKDRQDQEIKTKRINNWTQGTLVVEDVPTFTRFMVAVKTGNEKGSSRGGDKWVEGFSGEDTPLDTPEGFTVDPDTVNATHAVFSWEAVDTSPDRVKGFFVGYRIVYWRTNEPEDRRVTEIIQNQVPQCPPAGEEHVSRLRRAAMEDGMVADLWPWSEISAAIQVMNGGKSGSLSDPITFATPEGVPSAPMNFRISERGSHHLKVEWSPPLELNGKLLWYELSYKEVGGSGHPVKVGEMEINRWHKKIHDLKEDTMYEVYLKGYTSKGGGTPGFDEARTLISGIPDVPIFGAYDIGDNWVNVSWAPSEEEPPKNPGTYFIVEYKKPGEDEWSSTPRLRDHNWSNVTDLEPGPMEFRVVAVNVDGDRTYSDPTIIVIGPEVSKTEEASTAVASSSWFIALMCILILLVIILLIICLIRRNRGGKYPVHEKEKLAGRDPEKEDEEAGFGEYTKNDLPEKKKSRTSLNSEERPLESDTDSMAEYYETDPSKFNEDGSFIGQYGGKKKAEPDTTSPSALSTFV